MGAEDAHGQRPWIQGSGVGANSIGIRESSKFSRLETGLAGHVL